MVSSTPEIATTTPTTTLQYSENKQTTVNSKQGISTTTFSGTDKPAPKKIIQQYNNVTHLRPPRADYGGQAGLPQKINNRSIENLVDNLPLDTPTRKAVKKIRALSEGGSVLVGFYLVLKLVKNLV
jgi:hypothetical protein